MTEEEIEYRPIPPKRSFTMAVNLHIRGRGKAMTAYWLSCPKFTVRVSVDPMTDRHTITDTAPIVRTFVGQPLDNLVRWAKRFGDVQLERLP